MFYQHNMAHLHAASLTHQWFRIPPHKDAQGTVILICDLFQFPHSNIISLEYKNDKIFREKRPKNMFISNKKIKAKLSMKNISVFIGLKKIKKIIERQDKFVT